MSDASQSSPAAGLQFERLEPATTAPATTERAGVPCAGCRTTIRHEYYSLGGKSICASCRARVERTRTSSRTPRAFGKALAFGLGAAIAGAAVYYAVIALLSLEIGIVAILIGWMVGRAIQKALPGGGMRRYQVLAAVLTYFAVGMAYMPLMLGQMRKDAAARKSHAAAVIAQQGEPAGDSAAAVQPPVPVKHKPTGGSLIVGAGALILVALSLPLVAAFGSASGILTALIIGIGMRQAWRMTRAPDNNVTGPFRVGGLAAAPAS